LANVNSLWSQISARPGAAAVAQYGREGKTAMGASEAPNVEARAAGPPPGASSRRGNIMSLPFPRSPRFIRSLRLLKSVSPRHFQPRNLRQLSCAGRR
jgi:hypothetical protein